MDAKDFCKSDTESLTAILTKALNIVFQQPASLDRGCLIDEYKWLRFVSGSCIVSDYRRVFAPR